jgi:hypothetical protein
MFTHAGKLLTIVVLFQIAAFSQVATKTTGETLINRAKPPVYVEFVRTGKCTKDTSNFNFGDLCNSKRETARTFAAAWLRLVNNTRWSVGVTVDKAATERNSSPAVIDSTSFFDDDGETKAIGKMVANNGAEMDVVYKSEVETGCDFSKPSPKGQSCFRIHVTAPTIPLPSISSDLFVAPGRSIVFPVDRTHVKKYVNLYVLYNFSWEYSGKYFSHFPRYDSQHRAYFGWFDLEKGIKAEREKFTIADLR